MTQLIQGFAWSTEYSSKGRERLTGLSSAKALTVPSGVKLAVIQPLFQSVWITNDGVNPVLNDTGILLPAGSIWRCTGGFSLLRFLEAAASGQVEVQYWGG